MGLIFHWHKPWCYKFNSPTQYFAFYLHWTTWHFNGVAEHSSEVQITCKGWVCKGKVQPEQHFKLYEGTSVKLNVIIPLCFLLLVFFCHCKGFLCLAAAPDARFSAPLQFNNHKTSAVEGCVVSNWNVFNQRDLCCLMFWFVNYWTVLILCWSFNLVTLLLLLSSTNKVNPEHLYQFDMCKLCFYFALCFMYY